MFTGLVSAMGTVAALDIQDEQAAFRFAAGKLNMGGVCLGDSIAVNGVCLTVTAFDDAGFSADVSRETLDCTTLGEWGVGERVNLERALALGDALGGHLVTGHVDGVAQVQSIKEAGDSLRFELQAPASLARFIAAKGSVCIDGVSLTVNSVDDASFGVMIVPHTREQTIIASYCPGTRVNIEVDMIARYLERIVQYTGAA